MKCTLLMGTSRSRGCEERFQCISMPFQIWLRQDAKLEHGSSRLSGPSFAL